MRCLTLLLIIPPNPKFNPNKEAPKRSLLPQAPPLRCQVCVHRVLMVRQCILRLAPANEVSETSTYTGLMRLALGSAGEYSALFSIGVANWGSLVAFIKFMGDNLERFLPIVGLRNPEWIGCLAGLFCLTSTLEGHNEHPNPKLHPWTHRKNCSKTSRSSPKSPRWGWRQG